MTWDDHEVEDNYADRYSSRHRLDPVQFLEVRANAYQAYYEMMPLRKRSLPRGPNLDLYRTINFGRLAAFQVLDTRQYRTKQVNGNRESPLNADAIDPQNTIMGFEQAALAQELTARLDGHLERARAANHVRHAQRRHGR